MDSYFFSNHLSWCHTSPNAAFTFILTEIWLSPENFFPCSPLGNFLPLQNSIGPTWGGQYPSSSLLLHSHWENNRRWGQRSSPWSLSPTLLLSLFLETLVSMNPSLSVLLFRPVSSKNCTLLSTPMVIIWTMSFSN